MFLCYSQKGTENKRTFKRIEKSFAFPNFRYIVTFYLISLPLLCVYRKLYIDDLWIIQAEIKTKVWFKRWRESQFFFQNY